MGMFDNLIYENHEYQTKDTPQQWCELYEIRGNELWYKNVKRRWIDDPGAIFGGFFEELSYEWEHCKEFNGNLRFYREDKENPLPYGRNWIEYTAMLTNGMITKIERS